MSLHLYHVAPPEAEEALAASRILPQLQALDSKIRRKGLDSLDPSRNRLIAIGTEHDGHHVTRNSYGVLNLSWQAGKHHADWSAAVEAELQEIRNNINAAHKCRLQYLIWAGMGGSAEDKSAYQACGLLKKGVRCYVLDSTDPAKLKAILDDITRRSRLPLDQALRRTLVVGMALGMTSYEPVVNLQRLAALYDQAKIDSTHNFLYMTLPDSLLDQFAAPRGYRRVPLQLDGLNSTAGRHSSPLTRGSLYPLGLAGVDLNAWIKATALDESAIDEALTLAQVLDAESRAGRDKVTLLLPEPWQGIAIWTKQDFEESLGKSESLGLKIVIDEPVHARNYNPPKDPKQDRLFLVIQLQGVANPHAATLQSLRRAGYPVVVVTFPKRTLLSAYMQFIHYTVFGMGWLRKMNFITQPGVELYKAITSRIHASGEAKLIEPASSVSYGRDITLDFRFQKSGKADGSAPQILARLLADGFEEYGEISFFGDTRYSAEGRAARKVLSRGGNLLFRSILKAPVDVYEGPAMNHSYHEMIIGHGKCFSIVLIHANQSKDAAYHRSQFLATQMALAERGRRVVSLVLKNLGLRTLADLDQFFRETGQALKEILRRNHRNHG